jgi:hypothetical protein
MLSRLLLHALSTRLLFSSLLQLSIFVLNITSYFGKYNIVLIKKNPAQWLWSTHLLDVTSSSMTYVISMLVSDTLFMRTSCCVASCIVALPFPTLWRAPNKEWFISSTINILQLFSKKSYRQLEHWCSFVGLESDLNRLGPYQLLSIDTTFQASWHNNYLYFNWFPENLQAALKRTSKIINCFRTISKDSEDPRWQWRRAK